MKIKAVVTAVALIEINPEMYASWVDTKYSDTLPDEMPPESFLLQKFLDDHVNCFLRIESVISGIALVCQAYPDVEIPVSAGFIYAHAID